MASILDLVKHYQHAIEKYPNDEQKILKCIDKLFNLDVTVQHLQETGVGRTVNALRKEPGDVGQAARALVYKWKLMVAAEESDHEEDHNQSSSYNGHNNGKDHEDSDYEIKNRSNECDKYSKANRNEDKYKHKHMNGDCSKGKRKYQSSEEEQPHHKKSKHTIHNKDQHRKQEVQIKKEPLESDDYSHSDSSESEDSDTEDSYEEERQTKHKNEHSDRHKSSSVKHLHNKQEKHKNESSSSSKSIEHLENHSKHRELESRHSLEKSSSKEKSSSLKHNKDKETISSHKTHKLEHKNSDREKKHYKDESSSKHKSTSEKEKSDSLEKNKNHVDKSSSKSDKHKSSSSSSSHKSKSETDKHKSSAEKESSSNKHKSKEHSSSSKEKHSSSSKEISKDKTSSSKDKEDSHKHDKKHSSSSDRSSKEGVKNKNEKEDYKNNSSSSTTSKDKKTHSSSSHTSKSSNSKSSSSKSSSSKSSSSKSKDIPKKKQKTHKSEESDDGIDCGSGASFAEALGMVSPTKPKKKSTPVKDTSHSPNNSTDIDDLSPAALLAPTAKLAPLPSLEISALPEISPNYKPRPPPKFLPHFTDDDAMNHVISSKNQRTKVYSGNKVIGKIPTLYEMCVNILQEHIDALEFTGGVPYEILKPVVDRATPQQLFMLEHFNPYLMEDTDHLWQKFCEKIFRNKKRQEMETWREMYIRCEEEREHKLKSLTANIRISQEAKKAPIKQTKMAYVDTIVKPPRSVARKQAQHGTAFASTASPAARVAALAAAPNVLKGNGRPLPVTTVSTSSSSFVKPKKAPLMQKALQFMRGRKR